MRTTLDIEADVVAAAKELAQRQGVSAGKVVSSLLRSALTGKGASQPSGAAAVAGFRPFTASDQQLMSNEQIDQLRDLEGIGMRARPSRCPPVWPRPATIPAMPSGPSRSACSRRV